MYESHDPNHRIAGAAARARGAASDLRPSGAVDAEPPAWLLRGITDREVEAAELGISVFELLEYERLQREALDRAWPGPFRDGVRFNDY